jgi:hypothetical protein
LNLTSLVAASTTRARKRKLAASSSTGEEQQQAPKKLYPWMTDHRVLRCCDSSHRDASGQAHVCTQHVAPVTAPVEQGTTTTTTRFAAEDDGSRDGHCSGE